MLAVFGMFAKEKRTLSIQTAYLYEVERGDSTRYQSLAG